jgi:DNA polymerase I-like protein with 3'-5' exonuclease and polymerase domains
VPFAKEAGDQLRANPYLDFHQMVADLAGIERWQAKIMNLSLIYGKGAVAICRELGFPIEIVDWGKGPREVAGEEGNRFMAKYDKLVPWVKGLKEAVARVVKRRSYVKTILGRRCRFGGVYTKDHAAVNRIVQGSAGDQLKKAQVDAYEQWGEIPLVAVHDEGGYPKVSDVQIGRVVNCMVHAIELTVPVAVDVATGNNWGEAL